MCKECMYCWNYKVSEVGCYGSDKPCEHYVGEDRDEILSMLDEHISRKDEK